MKRWIAPTYKYKYEWNSMTKKESSNPQNQDANDKSYKWKEKKTEMAFMPTPQRPRTGHQKREHAWYACVHLSTHLADMAKVCTWLHRTQSHAIAYRSMWMACTVRPATYPIWPNSIETHWWWCAYDDSVRVSISPEYCQQQPNIEWHRTAVFECVQLTTMTWQRSWCSPRLTLSFHIRRQL